MSDFLTQHPTKQEHGKGKKKVLCEDAENISKNNFVVRLVRRAIETKAPLRVQICLSF